MDVRVLLVDDDAATRLVCRRAIRVAAPEGMRLVLDEAEDGTVAVEMLRHDPYDLVVSDYRMGAVLGSEVLAEAAALHPDALRVLMSGFPQAPDVVEAAQDPSVDVFVPKPARTEEYPRIFGAILRDLMARRSGPA